MNDEPTPASAIPIAAVGCLACQEEEIRRGSVRLRPLPPDAGLPQDPDGFDWNDYYWGSNIYHRSHSDKQRTIVRPLPRTIADRIPFEVFEQVLIILRYDGPLPGLYRCALVCRQWAHCALHLLYSCSIHIRDRAGYDALVQSVSRGALSRRYSSQTRSLYFTNRFLASGFSYTQPSDGHNPQEPSLLSKSDDLRSALRGRYFHTIPLRLGRLMLNLECLHISHITPPYHPQFIRSMSHFTHLVHLTLGSFTLCCFGDLRRMICGFPRLCRLDLLSEAKLSTYTGIPAMLQEGPGCNLPRITELRLEHVDQSLLSPLGAWIATTNVCEHAVHLSLFTRASYFTDPTLLTAGKSAYEEIFRKLGPSELASLDYRLQRYDRESLAFLLGLLRFCTRVSSMKLVIEHGLARDFWEELVFNLHTTFSSITSASVHSISLSIDIYPIRDGDHRSSGSTTFPSPYSDERFGEIAVQPLHEIVSLETFSALSSVELVVTWVSDLPMESEDSGVLSAEEMAQRIALILQPLDRRGILSVLCKNQRFKSWYHYRCLSNCV